MDALPFTVVLIANQILRWSLIKSSIHRFSILSELVFANLVHWYCGGEGIMYFFFVCGINGGFVSITYGRRNTKNSKIQNMYTSGFSPYSLPPFSGLYPF